jgi:hypothetical protein
MARDYLAITGKKKKKNIGYLTLTNTFLIKQQVSR